jgi:hypothetical protein
LHQVAGGFGVVPEAGGAGLFFEFRYARFIVGEVKVAPWCLRCAGGVRSPGRGVRSSGDGATGAAKAHRESLTCMCMHG